MRSVPTEDLQNRLLNWLLVGGSLISPPVTPLKAALFTLTPNFDTGLAGIEVTGGSYARTNISFGAASNYVISNDVLVTFPTATADWGTIEAIGIYDSTPLSIVSDIVITTPLPMWFGEIEPITIKTGGVFTINIGTIEVEVS